jgi:hypothetical protein
MIASDHESEWETESEPDHESDHESERETEHESPGRRLDKAATVTTATTKAGSSLPKQSAGSTSRHTDSEFADLTDDCIVAILHDQEANNAAVLEHREDFGISQG